jgi:hypothetical protein
VGATEDAMSPMRDVRLAKAEEQADLGRDPAPPRCEVCDCRLPRGARRTRCIDHSDYARRLMRVESARRARLTRRRAA